jgi:hypothetical protein
VRRLLATLPLVQRHRRGHNGQAKAADDAADDEHGIGPRSTRAGQQHGADADGGHAAHASIATAEIVAERVRDEDVAEPGAEIVDGGDETSVRGIRVVQRLLEAWVDIESRDDTNIIAGVRSV